MTWSSWWRVSGGVGDGFVLLEPCPLARGVVHFEDCVYQHGGAACAVCFGQDLCVLAQLDLDNVPLLWAWILCTTQRGSRQDITGQTWCVLVRINQRKKHSLFMSTDE